MNVQPQERSILHIAPRSLWEQGKDSGAYQGNTLDSEGFLHCSRVNHLVAMANAMFRGHHDLVLLLIQTSRVASPMKYEGATSEVYHRIYGPVNCDAVIAVYDFLPDEHGEFHLPEEVIRRVGAWQSAGITFELIGSISELAGEPYEGSNCHLSIQITLSQGVIPAIPHCIPEILPTRVTSHVARFLW
jgi:uncharacterized protein (DUF952 family)